MSEGFTILEHPADVGIEARGGSLASAFRYAAEGLMSLILDLATVGTTESRDIEIHGSDKEQLLVRWLSEILYLYDGQRFVAREFVVSVLTDTTLVAHVVGEPLSMAKHTTRLDVKAITYHQLVIHESNGEAIVRVFLDI